MLYGVFQNLEKKLFVFRSPFLPKTSDPTSILIFLAHSWSLPYSTSTTPSLAVTWKALQLSPQHPGTYVLSLYCPTPSSLRATHSSAIFGEWIQLHLQCNCCPSLKVWPIHCHFRLPIIMLTSGKPVRRTSSSFEIVSVQRTPMTRYWRKLGGFG